MEKCSSSNDDESGVPSLTIVNNYPYFILKAVTLQDYSFENLEVEYGSRRTFVLNNGIPSGSLDIAVTIRYDCSGRDDRYLENIRVDFYDGQTTTIAINSNLDQTDADRAQTNCEKYYISIL